MSLYSNRKPGKWKADRTEHSIVCSSQEKHYRDNGRCDCRVAGDDGKNKSFASWDALGWWYKSRVVIHGGPVTKTVVDYTPKSTLPAAAAAKQALLARFRARPAADDPAVQARLAEQKAVADARDARGAERKAARDAEAARVADERAIAAAQDAVRLAEEAAAAIIRQEEEQRRAVEAAARKVEAEAAAKARRDAKYAARKARR